MLSRSKFIDGKQLHFDFPTIQSGVTMPHLVLYKAIKIQRHDNKSKIGSFYPLIALLKNELKETSMETCSALLKEPLCILVPLKQFCLDHVEQTS